MDKYIKELLSVILVLTVLNSICLVYLIIQGTDKVPVTVKSEIKHELPIGLRTEQEKSSLFKKVLDLYNNQNFLELYHLVDESARLKLSDKDVVKSLQFMHDEATGKIVSGAYSHFDFESIGELTDVITLYFNIKFEKRTGRLSLNVLDDQSFGFKIVNLNFSLDK